MLCSYTNSGKSNSNWLDRLRSLKGIPTDHNLDLDSFLLSSAPITSPLARPTNPTRIPPPDTRDPPFRTVLAELFLGYTNTYNKKCPRKQTNPKFFPPSSAADPPAPVEPSVDRAEEEDNNDTDEHELKGFSRNEVTVIDTSCPGWKVDKLVFRKNHVWKVREKRSKKNKFFAKRKINANANAITDVDGIGSSDCLDHRHCGIQFINRKAF